MSQRIIGGDALTILATLPHESVQAVITSPPYWGMRSYLPADHPDQRLEIGTEQSIEEYVAHLVAIFHEARRVLKKTGVLWLNLGDCYSTEPGWGRGGGSTLQGRKQSTLGGPKRPVVLPRKNLIGLPWRVALALQQDGWILRADVIWEKPNALPDPAQDRPARTHEYLFLLSREQRYYYRAASETKSIWRIHTERGTSGHPAPMPAALVSRCILSSSRHGDTVLDPFSGSGTVPHVAHLLGREGIGIELNPAYMSAKAEHTIHEERVASCLWGMGEGEGARPTGAP